MTRPTYHNDRNQLRVLSFESFRKAMLYAGYDENGKFDNWKLAIEFAKCHGMYPVQETEGGKFLNIPNREEIEEYPKKQLKKIWKLSSIRYCLNIEGSIKTFVCGADDQSIFRRREIQSILRAKGVEDVNGQSVDYYKSIRTNTLKTLRENNARLSVEQRLSGRELHFAAMDAVYVAIGENEVAQDFKIACDAGDVAEQAAVLSRLTNLHDQIVQEQKDYLKSKWEKASVAPSNDNQDIALEEMYQANPHLRVGGLSHGYHAQ